MGSLEIRVNSYPFAEAQRIRVPDECMVKKCPQNNPTLIYGALSRGFPWSPKPSAIRSRGDSFPECASPGHPFARATRSSQAYRVWRSLREGCRYP